MNKFDLVNNPKNPDIIADAINTEINYFLTTSAISQFSPNKYYNIKYTYSLFYQI